MASEKSKNALSEIVAVHHKERLAAQAKRVLERKIRRTHQAATIKADKRKHDRISFTADVQCITNAALMTAQTVDLSEAGIKLRGCSNLAVGQSVKLYIPLPKAFQQKKALCLFEGKVTWATDEAAGIQFVDSDSKTFKELRALLWENGVTVRTGTNEHAVAAL